MTELLHFFLVRLRTSFASLIYCKRKSNPSVCCKKGFCKYCSIFSVARHHTMHVENKLSGGHVRYRADYVHFHSGSSVHSGCHVLCAFLSKLCIHSNPFSSFTGLNIDVSSLGVFFKQRAPELRDGSSSLLF